MGKPRALELRGLELVAHTDLEGKGDGMQVMRNGDVAYVVDAERNVFVTDRVGGGLYVLRIA